MRAAVIAAAIGLLATTSSAFAQGQASASLTVSVQVVRTCTVRLPSTGTPDARVTGQCSSAAAPRTQVADVPAPPAATRDSSSNARVRVLTVNF